MAVAYAYVGQVVIRLHHASIVAVSVTDHDQHFLVAFLSFVGAPHHASLDDFDNQRTLRTVTNVDLGPVLFCQALRSTYQRASKDASDSGRDRNKRADRSPDHGSACCDGTANR